MCSLDVLDRYEALASEEHEWALFEPQLVRFYRMLPNEYLYYYYYREQAVANIQASGSTRGEQILGINEPLWRELGHLMAAGRIEHALRTYERRMSSRNQTYMARESGRLSPRTEEGTGTEGAEAPDFAGEGYAGQAMAVMAAIAAGKKATLVLNVRGQSSWGDLAADDVIEAPSLVDQHGPHPLAQAPMPESVRPLITAIKAYERLTIEAAVRGHTTAAVQALTVHPLVMSYSLARRIVDEYLQVHRAYLPQFAEQGALRSLSMSPSKSLVGSGRCHARQGGGGGTRTDRSMPSTKAVSIRKESDTSERWYLGRSRCSPRSQSSPHDRLERGTSRQARSTIGTVVRRRVPSQSASMATGASRPRVR